MSAFEDVFLNFKVLFHLKIFLFAVPPEAGTGFGETTHEAAEDIGGAERLSEAARKVGKDELQGDLIINFLFFSISIDIIIINDSSSSWSPMVTILLMLYKSQVNSVQAPLEMRVASRLSYERFTFLTEGQNPDE